MPLTLTVQRKTRADDGQGGHVETPVSVFTTPGRIAMISGNDQTIAAQKSAVVTNAVYVLPGTDLRVGDRIVAGGRTYEVRVTALDAPGYPYSKALIERYVPVL